MDTLDALDRASNGFASVLAQVTDSQWGDPTGNDGQDVGALVDHVIGGDRMATVILEGGSREEGIAQFARSANDADRLTAFAQSSRDLAAAFRTPGALDRIVAHPALDMPGAQLLGFRLAEYALHGWDLARAIGADDTIDPDVVQVVWDFSAPLAGIMAGSGMFGQGASGSVGEDAPLQDRLLDISGRRPS
jgi:uncharacterized protein (TIGR03086 family)